MAARYSRHAGYTISERKKTAPRSTVRTVPRTVSFGPTAARYFGIGILAVIAVVMLTQSSTRATSAYKQTDLRNQLSQVQGDINSLNLEAQRAQSLQSIQNSQAATQMVPVQPQDVQFVEKGQVAGVATARPDNATPTP